MRIKLACLLLLFFASCTSFNSPLTDRGIEGQVFVGPMCPVVREGEACPDQPHQVLLTVTNPKGERIVQIQTDEQGRFRIPLPAGEYVLHPESPNVFPFADEQKIVIEEGKFSQVVVN